MINYMQGVYRTLYVHNLNYCNDKDNGTDTDHLNSMRGLILELFQWRFKIRYTFDFECSTSPPACRTGMPTSLHFFILPERCVQIF